MARRLLEITGEFYTSRGGNRLVIFTIQYYVDPADVALYAFLLNRNLEGG